MNTARSLFVAVLAGGLVAVALAQTSPEAPAAASAANSAAPQAAVRSTASAPMSIPQIVEYISAKGYTDLREVERKSEKLYEIKARDAKGQWVELDVDSRSGEVLKTEFKRKP